jgi:mannose-6-phosphate isomerase-like protein (cupin superfamily)
VSKVAISADQAAAMGVVAHHERMEIGELRFRLMGKDGSGYIRTVAAPSGGWQRSHSHTRIRETYIVQEGWIAMAVRRRDIEPEMQVTILRAGDVFTTNIGEVHNVFMAGGAVTHTVKHGPEAAMADWLPCAEFDTMTRRLSEEEIRRLSAA